MFDLFSKDKTLFLYPPFLLFGPVLCVAQHLEVWRLTPDSPSHLARTILAT
jgi:hypothetical protein